MYKRIYLLFFLIFLVLLAAIYLHRRSLIELDKSILFVDNTHEVTSSLDEISGDLKTTELHLDSRHPDAPIIDSDFTDIMSDLRKLPPLISNPEQEARIDSISFLINSWRIWLFTVTNDTLNPTVKAVGNEQITAIQKVINRSIAKQQELLSERHESLKFTVKALHRWTIVLIGMAFLIIVFTSVYGFRQVKNRIELEMLLESILNATQEGIITCKTCRDGFKIEDFVIVFANSAVKSHLNLEPSQLIGKSIFYIMPEIQSSGLLAKWIQVVEDGSPDEYEAAHIDAATKKENWYSVKLVKLGDGVTVTFHNITELRTYKQGLGIT